MHRTASVILGLFALGQLACAGTVQGGAIFVMKVDGSEVRKVAEVEGHGGHGSPRFSHDDKRLAFDAGTGGNETQRFFVVNLDGTGLQELGAHAMPDWSPDDKQLAYHNYGTGTQAGVYVQNLDGQGRVFLTEGGSPRWSPDGSQLAFTDWRTIKILDVIEGQQRLLVDEPFEQYQIGFDWSPDGKRLAFVAKRNNQRELWIAGTDPKSEPARVRLTAHLNTHVAWSSDGKRLAITLDDKIQLLDVDGTQGPEPVPGQEGKSRDLAWSHDGKWIAFASDRKAAGMPQTAARAAWKLELVPRRDRGAPAYNVDLSADGKRAVLGGHTGKAGFQSWDFEQDTLTQHKFAAVFLALAPNSRTLAATGLNLKIQLVDLDTGELQRDINLDGIVTSLRFSKDGARLVATTLNRKAHVLDVATGETLTVFKKHEGYVFRAVMSPDGKEAMSVGQDKKLRLWNATTAEERLAIEHPEAICGLAVSPDGRHVLTGTGGTMPQNAMAMTMERGNDNALRMWDTATGKLVREMKGHTHAVYAIDVSADGRLAVTGGWDGAIRVWDLQTGDEVAQAQGQGSVMDVKFSPDAKRVLVGGGATRFAGEDVRYFNNERVRLYQLNRQ